MPQLLSVKRLGKIDPPQEGLYPIWVYFLTYTSAVSGGVKLSAKLFIPEGKSPKKGWRTSVWCHGVGDPASDYRRFPFQGHWDNSRGALTGRWAHYGYVTLTPWLVGAGPSEPMMTYSPFSLDRNAQGVIDSFLIFKSLEEVFTQYSELIQDTRIDPHFDFENIVLRTDCVSNLLLVYLMAHYRDHPALQGVTALVADDFQPSIAYNNAYLNPFLLRLPLKSFLSLQCLYARLRWALVKEKGWELTQFFTPLAIDLFSQPVSTVVGIVDRIFASQLVPPQRSELAGFVESEVRSFFLGKDPTPQEGLRWLYSPDLVAWMQLEGIENMIRSTFYQTYFAQSDPFFAETITPFHPDIPLIIVAKSGQDAVHIKGLPSFDDRYQNMTLPKINTLKSWGWKIEVIKQDQGGTSYSGGAVQQEVLNRLKSEESTLPKLS